MKRTLRVLTVMAVVLVLAAGVAYAFRKALVLAVFAYMLEPSLPFDPARIPAAPDYADPAAWAALPEKDDAADWLPPGYTESPYPRRDAIDVFYIHPTGFFGTANWNAAMGERSEMGIPTEAMLASQATPFNGVGRVYAPAYRQATLYSFVEAGRENGKTNGKQALELAYSDVAAAFAYFQEHYNRDRPFILASHSQGSGHALRLIAEQIDGTAVRERMIAAYVVGCGMPEDFFTRVYKNIPPGTSPTQTGCILSWDTVRAGTPRSDDGFHYYYPEGWELAAGKKRFCVNPLTWTQDPARAPASTNDGALLMTIGASGEDVGPDAVEGLLPEATWAELHGDIVWVRDLSDEGFASMISNITGSYHVYDYSLFWVNIRENARLRAEAWFGAEEAEAKERVAYLLKALKSDGKMADWWEIMRELTSLSTDDIVLDAVMNFIQRPVHWKMLPHYERSDVLVSKAQALLFLGGFDREKVVGVLAKSITHEGAEELLSAWIDQELPYGIGKTDLLGIVRSSSAKALGELGDPDSRRLVREWYEKLKAKGGTSLRGSDHFLFYGTIDALGFMDAVEELGLDAARERMPTEDNPLGGLGEYYNRYLVGGPIQDLKR